MERAEVWPLLRESPPLVFVNPAASRVRAFLPRIRKTFESLGIRAQFAPTNNPQDLELAARQAVSQNPSVLFAMGGDGTFQALAK